MRTTVDLPDELLLEVQRMAREQNRTMRSVMEEALRSMMEKYRHGQAFELADASVGGNGLQQAFRDASWDDLRAAAYGGPPVIAVDTNILVYAHRRDSPFHDAAARRLTGLAEGTSPWVIPWPCIHQVLLHRHPPAHLRPAQHHRAGLRAGQRLARVAIPGPDQRGQHALGDPAQAGRCGPGDRSAGARRAHRRALPGPRRDRVVDPQPGLQQVPRPQGRNPLR